MKKSPKTKTKKPTSLKAFAQLSTTQKRVVVLILAVLLLILGTWLWHVVSVRNDRARFAEAEKRKEVAFAQLIVDMGQPMQVQGLNRCYNAEQGPFNDGRLWCNTISAAYFSEDVPDDEIKQRFNTIIEQNNWRRLDKRFGDYEFEGARNLPCELIVYSDDTLASDPTFYLPDVKGAKQLVIVRCSDRAKAKYYPYLQ